MDAGKDEHMSIKLFGAICIVVACGGYGFFLAIQHFQKIKQLENLISALHHMKCELQYRQPSLSQLCRQCGNQTEGNVSKAFLLFAYELEQQCIPNVHQCMRIVIDKVGLNSTSMGTILQDLGNNLGMFDIGGQLLSLERIQKRCEKELEGLQSNSEIRARSYQTLGLCAGAAIVILLV